MNGASVGARTSGSSRRRQRIGKKKKSRQKWNRQLPKARIFVHIMLQYIYSLIELSFRNFGKKKKNVSVCVWRNAHLILALQFARRRSTVHQCNDKNFCLLMFLLVFKCVRWCVRRSPPIFTTKIILRFHFIVIFGTAADIASYIDQLRYTRDHQYIARLHTLKLYALCERWSKKWIWFWLTSVQNFGWELDGSVMTHGCHVCVLVRATADWSNSR